MPREKNLVESEMTMSDDCGISLADNIFYNLFYFFSQIVRKLNFIRHKIHIDRIEGFV